MITDFLKLEDYGLNLIDNGKMKGAWIDNGGEEWSKELMDILMLKKMEIGVLLEEQIINLYLHILNFMDLDTWKIIIDGNF